MRRAVAVGLAVVVVVTATVAGVIAYQRTDTCRGVDIVFDGYGSVTCKGDSVTLSPAEATDDDVTHAALAALPAVSTDTAGSRSVEATVSTSAQLREGTPNPWEVGWFLWNYTDADHFYAVVLKPNGWEISKQDTDYEGNQRFLASGHDLTFAVGTSHHIQVTTTASEAGLVMDVAVDGVHLATVTDAEHPYTTGSVALYCEDATVTFSQVRSTASTPSLAPTP